MASRLFENEIMSARDVESGYASGSSSAAAIPDIYLTKPHLKFLNQQLQMLRPEGAFVHFS
jgi:phosphoadenosine phosphosulfate reductase